MRNRILAAGWLLCILSLAVVLNPALATDYPCVTETPGGNPCQECHTSWLFGIQRDWSCNSSAQDMDCGLDPPGNGWVCTETSQDCPGVVVDWDENTGCTEGEDISTAACTANYSTATSIDHGDDPNCGF